MQIIFDGQKAFSKYKELLQNAKSSIWISMYMIRRDEYTKELWEILRHKHRTGVKVTVVYDLYGSVRSLPWLASSPFAKAFVPKWWRPFTRNHTKMMIIDGKIGVVSGRNFTRRYYEEWQDASIILEKPKTLKALKAIAKRVEQKNTRGPGLDSVLRITDPLRYEKPLYNFILENIVKSKRRIVMASPYFVIDDALENILLAAADRGVKITIIVPRKPEHRLAGTFNRINFQRIHHKNVKVMRSQGMFHSKVMLFDQVALVGSANFDNRSFKYNMEASVIMEDKHIAKIKRHIKEVADHSVSYNWFQRAYDTLLYHLTRHLMEFL